MWLLMIGCTSALTITIEETSKTTVEAGTILEDLLDDIGFDDFVTMDITASEELKNQGVEPGDIREARMTMLELRVLSPEGGDLAFIDEMALSVESPDVELATLASQDSFPEGESVVPFDLADLDLTPYVVSQSLSINTDVTAHRPSEDVEIEAWFQLEVTATVQGAVNQVKD